MDSLDVQIFIFAGFIITLLKHEPMHGHAANSVLGSDRLLCKILLGHACAVTCFLGNTKIERLALRSPCRGRHVIII